VLTPKLGCLKILKIRICQARSVSICSHSRCRYIIIFAKNSRQFFRLRITFSALLSNFQDIYKSASQKIIYFSYVCINQKMEKPTETGQKITKFSRPKNHNSHPRRNLYNLYKYFLLIYFYLFNFPCFIYIYIFKC
jgi:hypothetical protein